MGGGDNVQDEALLVSLKILLPWVDCRVLSWWRLLSGCSETSGSSQFFIETLGPFEGWISNKGILLGLKLVTTLLYPKTLNECLVWTSMIWSSSKLFKASIPLLKKRRNSQILENTALLSPLYSPANWPPTQPGQPSSISAQAHQARRSCLSLFYIFIINLHPFVILRSFKIITFRFIVY